jgi:hypothetical protein
MVSRIDATPTKKEGILIITNALFPFIFFFIYDMLIFYFNFSWMSRHFIRKYKKFFVILYGVRFLILNRNTIEQSIE